MDFFKVNEVEVDAVKPKKAGTKVVAKGRPNKLEKGSVPFWRRICLHKCINGKNEPKVNSNK